MRISLALGMFSLLMATEAGHAGPCASNIDQLQARIDALVDAEAGAGKAGKETTAATMSRQPTPKSIAAAEASLDDDSKYQKALAALSQARAIDATGNSKGCAAAVRQVNEILGP